MELATEVARLAEIGERLLEHIEQRERRERAAQLEQRYPDTPKRLDLAMLLGAIPGLARRFEKMVPDEFVARTGDGELEVACPCGNVPLITGVGVLISCQCERWFVYDGFEVHVAHTAVD